FFGPRSFLGPILRNEFVKRSESATAAEALRSLAADLFDKPHLGLIYSRFPLSDYGKRSVSLKNDLILSHIELHQAEGMTRHHFPSLSEAFESYRTPAAAAVRFWSELTRVKQRVSRELKKRESALRGSEADIARLGNPEKLKRRGELILANLPTAAV